MQIRIYQVDAFAGKVFSGNPAAVCPLEHWLPDVLLQQIAMENNLSETAFYVSEKDAFHIRWFTPAVEVDLCGHATLAAAHVLFSHEHYAGDIIVFSSRSGKLIVTREGHLLTLDFPTDTFSEVSLHPELTAGFNIQPQQAFRGKTDFLLVFAHESEIRNLCPDFSALKKIKARGIIATAKGDRVDFVSRFFAPQAGVNEDPVTGSAHTTLTPYWAKILGKTELNAIQCSERQGELKCKLKGDRVEISGQAKTYLQGKIFIP